MRLSSLFVLGLVVIGCTATHDPNARSIGSTDCYTCHKPAYDGTTTPVHATDGCAITCADCHSAPTTNTPAGVGWVNNLGGCRHPENKFPLVASPHTGIACLTCHNAQLPGTGVMGANTDCISCHPNDAHQADVHTGLVSVQGQGYAYSTTQHNFCLSCHPNGLANHHLEAIFPSSHHNSTCAGCHDLSMSNVSFAGNANCFSSKCHVQAAMDTRHAQVGKYATEKATPPTVPDGVGGTQQLTQYDYCAASGCHYGGRTP